jgi:hypothetical protein
MDLLKLPTDVTAARIGLLRMVLINLRGLERIAEFKNKHFQVLKFVIVILYSGFSGIRENLSYNKNFFLDKNTKMVEALGKILY